ncbi:hypothetical protein SteCoe_3716 [Stentor coeruleus]|uniref:Cation efflux protein transmembrane domain-containing protein n=1 Tax=Stentor coeruleus TaxID=5963 RepID=A0A1R2CWJ7_9CILI|nr:hypothetical protein SteCoe_3716 [Stentor coeruleus]
MNMIRKGLLRTFSQVDETGRILKRELIGDAVQISLKYGAYYLSQSQAVKAELMRSMLDSSNHFLLYFSNTHAKKKSDEFYNHSYSKFKNIFVLFPATGFIISGLYNVFFPFFYSIPDTLELNNLSLSSIIISSFGEFYLFYKNLGDIQNFSEYNILKGITKRISLAYNVIANKITIDPIQDAIVNENILAITGVCLPIFTSLMCYISGFGIFDTIGSVLNGVLQIYLGYMLSVDNIKVLAGQSLDPKNTEIIMKLIEKNKKVKSVDEIKTEILGFDAMKISTTIKYNSQAIGEEIMNELKDEIDSMCKTPEDKDTINKIIKIAVEETLLQTSQSIKIMEILIYEKFPHVTDVDLEISKNKVIEDKRFN